MRPNATRQSVTELNTELSWKGLPKAVQTGYETARLNVQVVAVAEQLAQLTEGDPAVIPRAVQREVVFHLDDLVPILGVVEAAALFGEESVEPDAGGVRAEHVVEVARLRKTGVVLAQQLQRRSELGGIDEPGLDAGVHEHMHDPFDRLGQEGDDAAGDRGEQGLPPRRHLPVTGLDVDRDHPEVLAVLAGDLTV